MTRKKEKSTVSRPNKSPSLSLSLCSELVLMAVVVALSCSGATASHLRPPFAASTNHAPRFLPFPLPATTPTSRITSATSFSRTPTSVHSSSDNLTAIVASPANTETEYTAEEVVRRFYEGINRGDLSSVADLISDDCVYEDLIFPAPFVGRKAIMDFFGKFIDTISRDLQFVIDDISAEDSVAVGVTWHLEWKGKLFPFSKGCSFYLLKINNGKRQIKYGRDSVEPAIKPGETALVAIKGVTWLLQQFPQLAKWL